MADKPTAQPDDSGGRGDIPPEDEYPIAGAAYNKLVGSMLNPQSRWHITPRHKEVAIGITVRNMANENGRVSNGAVSNLIKMEAQNQAEDLKSVPDLHLHAYADVEEQRAAARSIVAASRARRLSASQSCDRTSDGGNGHAGGLGSNGQPGDVASGTTPRADQHGSNGSHSGNGSKGSDS